MTRKITLLGLTVLLLAALVGCTSKKADNVTTDTQAKTENTEDKTEGTSKEDRPKLKLKGLTDESGESDIFTDEELECLEEAAIADPVLGPVVEDGDEPSGPEEEEALAIIMLQCLGQERIAELVVDELAADPEASAYLDLNCFQTALENLAGIDVVLLLLGGSDAEAIAASAVGTCIDRVAFAEALSAELAASDPTITADQLLCVEVQVLLLSDATIIGLVEQDPAAASELQAVIAANCA
jgi:hypothetical protein